MATALTYPRFANGKVVKTMPVDVRVTRMSAADALWWDTHLRPEHLRYPARADRRWSWLGLLSYSVNAQRLKGRNCRCLVVWARNDDGLFVRAAMMILVENYPHLPAGSREDSHFCWFLSVAEEEVLKTKYQMSNPPSLVKLLVSIATILSFNAGLSGRIGLHAHPAGGANLLGIYERHCRLLNIPLGAGMSSRIRSTTGMPIAASDGRYFFSDSDVFQHYLGFIQSLGSTTVQI